jgi:hypothetical protein
LAVARRPSCSIPCHANGGHPVSTTFQVGNGIFLFDRDNYPDGPFTYVEPTGEYRSTRKPNGPGAPFLRVGCLPPSAFDELASVSDRLTQAADPECHLGGRGPGMALCLHRAEGYWTSRDPSVQPRLEQAALSLRNALSADETTTEDHTAPCRPDDEGWCSLFLTVTYDHELVPTHETKTRFELALGADGRLLCRTSSRQNIEEVLLQIDPREAQAFLSWALRDATLQAPSQWPILAVRAETTAKLLVAHSRLGSGSVALPATQRLLRAMKSIDHFPPGCRAPSYVSP